MKKVRIIVKSFAVIMLILSAMVFGSVYYVGEFLPSSFQVYEGEKLILSSAVPVTAAEPKSDTQLAQASNVSAGTQYDVEIKVLGLFPVKTASVNVVSEDSVMVLGTPFGIKIYADGVMVVGLTDVDSESGLINPASRAGIKKGDIIISIDGLKVSSNENISEIIESSNGDTLEFLINRDSKKLKLKVKPLKSKSEDKYKVGLWVRDSSAGIGTLTFYNPKTDIAAGLGHAICDNDTGEIIPLNHGELVCANIISVEKGSAGSAGELKGIFKNQVLGEFLLNNNTGVYGNIENATELTGKYMQVENKQNVKEGKAKILTTVEGETPQYYSCEIEKVHFNDDSDIQNMIIKITDKELLEKSGGIVQGMSGSPIIQNGKLIGAVTHVFVDDATKGYGIFAENMLKNAQGVAQEKLKEVS